jgi:hypothetical protein
VLQLIKSSPSELAAKSFFFNKTKFKTFAFSPLEGDDFVCTGSWRPRLQGGRPDLPRPYEDEGTGGREEAADQGADPGSPEPARLNLSPIQRNEDCATPLAAVPHLKKYSLIPSELFRKLDPVGHFITVR